MKSVKFTAPLAIPLKADGTPRTVAQATFLDEDGRMIGAETRLTITKDGVLELKGDAPKNAVRADLFFEGGGRGSDALYGVQIETGEAKPAPKKVTE